MSKAHGDRSTSAQILFKRFSPRNEDRTCGWQHNKLDVLVPLGCESLQSVYYFCCSQTTIYKVHKHTPRSAYTTSSQRSIPIRAADPSQHKHLWIVSRGFDGGRGILTSRYTILKHTPCGFCLCGLFLHISLWKFNISCGWSGNSVQTEKRSRMISSANDVFTLEFREREPFAGKDLRKQVNALQMTDKIY